MQSSALLSDLKARTMENIDRAKQLQTLPLNQLNHKASAESWSALECIEHLNRYGDFYLPEIRSRIQNALYPATEQFKTGWLGNYFAKSMLPKERLNKMKTFAAMNPNGSQLKETVLLTFVEQQNEMLRCLEQAESVDLTKTKTSISISSWIKLRLGNTFRVVIYHNQRHLVQAERAVE
ncbi:MAG: DinB family protein [Phaeodactylibacter sp.]|nr:DinB family protein [Phaeodactylibacter sp.]